MYLLKKVIMVCSALALLVALSCMSEPQDVYDKGNGTFVTFEATENGIVIQRFVSPEDQINQKELKWFSFGDMGISWINSENFADTLTLDGGEWRLPTLEELSTLKHDGSSMYNVSSSFRSNGWFLWSSEPDGESSYWGINLHDGAGYESRHFDCLYLDSRAFVVKESN